jgi:hypothetical protein
MRAVDTTLVRQADGSVAPRAAASNMVFSGGGDAALARIAAGADWMARSWPAVLPPATATYPNVLPEVDVVVEAGVEGFAEFVVVRSAKAAANPALARLRFGLASSGLTIHEEDGGIVALAAGGKPVFSGPAPRMWDSAGVPAGRVSAEGTRSRSTPRSCPRYIPATVASWTNDWELQVRPPRRRRAWQANYGGPRPAKPPRAPEAR